MLDETSFHATLCGKILNFFDCEERLKLDMRFLSSFADPLPSPLDASGNLQTNFVYEPGVRGDILVVRAFLPLADLRARPRQRPAQHGRQPPHRCRARLPQRALLEWGSGL